MVRSQLTVLVESFAGKSTAALSKQARIDRHAFCHDVRWVKVATFAVPFEFRPGHIPRIPAWT